jgi:hypothetical protein
MRSLALFVASVIMVVGLVGIVTPDSLMAVGRHMATPAGLYVVAALRVGIGLVLIMVAPISRVPRTLRWVGAFVLVAGVATPFFGLERTQATLDWIATQGTVLIRLGASLALAIGACIAFAVATGRRPA